MFGFWFNLAIHVVMLLVDIALWYAVFRLTRNRFWRIFISLFISVQMVALLTLHSPLERLVKYGPKFFLVAVIIWHNLAFGIGISALVLYVITHLGKWTHRNAKKVTGGKNPPPPSAEPAAIPLARRQFLGACVSVAPALLTTGFTGLALHQLDNFRVRRAILSIPSLPRQLDGLTIAQVSDIHVGVITCGQILRDLVKTTNDLRTDLVLLTGDLINYDLSDLSGALDLVKAMPGRYGQCLIEGNHDLLADSAEFRRRTKASGISFLLNETSTINVRGYPVQFLGLNWSKAHGHQLDTIINAQLRELMKQRQPDAFPIFLAHHPHAFDAAVNQNLPLTLSGHTHGGQLMLDANHGAGSLLFRYWSGAYQRGNSQLFVSNGVGNMFPVRINAPAEVVHITLRCADARG